MATGNCSERVNSKGTKCYFYYPYGITFHWYNGYVKVIWDTSSRSRIWSRGGPSSGPPDLANVVEWSQASKVSISRHGVWGPP